MKKKVLFVCGSVLLVIALGFVIAPCLLSHHYDVAVLEKVEFGMTPSQVKWYLGAPQDFQSSDCNGGATVRYRYETVIDGEQVNVSLYFVSNGWKKQLYEVCLDYPGIESEPAAEQILCSLTNKLWEAYQDQAGFLLKMRIRQS